MNETEMFPKLSHCPKLPHVTGTKFQLSGTFLRLTDADLLYEWNLLSSADCSREIYVALVSLRYGFKGIKRKLVDENDKIFMEIYCRKNEYKMVK